MTIPKGALRVVRDLLDTAVNTSPQPTRVTIHTTRAKQALSILDEILEAVPQDLRETVECIGPDGNCGYSHAVKDARYCAALLQHITEQSE